MPYGLATGAASCLTEPGTRRANTSKAAATEVKYCSDRCKRQKPSNAPDSLDKKIEHALSALLQGRPPPGITDDGEAPLPPPKAQHKPKKGDPRIVIQLSELETAVFGNRQDPEKIYGRNKNKKSRFIRETGEWKSVDMVDHPATAAEGTTADPEEDQDTAGSFTDESFDDPPIGVNINDHIRLPQTQSDVNFSAGGGERGWAEKIEETPEMLAKRREGQKRAEEKELVKKVARRAIAFGLLVDAPPEKAAGGKRGGKKGQSAEVEQTGNAKVTRKCECLMSGQVVEPSFAKGNW